MPVTYFNPAGQRGSKPFPDLNIVVKLMSDGTTVTTKALY